MSEDKAGLFRRTAGAGCASAWRRRAALRRSGAEHDRVRALRVHGLIGADQVARVVSAYVERLDLSAL